MIPFNNASAPASPGTLVPGDSLLVNQKSQFMSTPQSPGSSVSSLPYMRSNPSTSTLFASTPNLPASRSTSPSAGLTSSKTLTGSVFVGTPTEDDVPNQSANQPEDPRYIIQQAFVPHIAVYSSIDTDDLIRDKGFPQGFWQLLRPYGEKVQGKVTIRDSVGASRVYDDFSIRFVQLGDGLESIPKQGDVQKGTGNVARERNGFVISSQQSRTGGNIERVEAAVDKQLSLAEAFPDDYPDQKDYFPEAGVISPFYALYLRKLLSGIPLVPHETFSHPVMCIIAISSRNSQPIETLRRLYDESSHGDRRLPAWVNSEYLRYYVLVHDEEKDEITKSITLFDQMKRHFGLHCHLLRLRGSECIATDDDSTEVPECRWMPAIEEMEAIQGREGEEGVEYTHQYIFDSDATAIRTFIRELVTQSVIPSMERCVSTWNDQVASRRRGISGRFISLSKKWAGFGGSTRPSSGPGTSGATPNSNNNYDIVQGFYGPDTPEALMRKLADYAFMLRDWKLAQSTYDILRADFNNDKAWKYHASANEMAAISILLGSKSITSKTRSETVDQMLETAAYSYITRCDATYGALRCLVLGMELLRLRNGSATDDAARWGFRILETKLVGQVGEALVKERVAACYYSHKGRISGSWGKRTRKSALWNILAVEQWLVIGKHLQAESCLSRARRLYEMLPTGGSISRFSAANNFLVSLEHQLWLSRSTEVYQARQEPMKDVVPAIDEESESFEPRTHRTSLIGVGMPSVENIETAPLRTLPVEEDIFTSKSDDFE